MSRHDIPYQKKILRINALSVLAVVLFLSLSLSLLSRQSLYHQYNHQIELLRSKIYEQKKNYIKDIVDMTIRGLQADRDLYMKELETLALSMSLKGISVSPEELYNPVILEERAAHRIRTTELQDNGYLWVNQIIDYGGGENYAIRRVHPNLIHTEGISLSTGLTDAAGNTPYLTELEGVRQNGEIFFSYWFKKKDSSKIAEKLSYARLYKELDWVVATGVYLDDIEKVVEEEGVLIRASIHREFLLALTVSLVIALLSMAAALILNHRLREVLKYYEKTVTENERNLELQVEERTTEMIQLERKLLHSQKLESLGIMAGGIAHDFNNLLVPIMGFSELGILHPDTPELCKRYFNRINKSSVKASKLTKQILAYSKQQVMEIETVDLNLLIKDADSGISPYIPERIKLEYNLTKTSCPVSVDRDQLEQVILNMVLNARDAIGEGAGRITVSTAPAGLSEEKCRELQLPLKEYVSMSIIDTGGGIPQENLLKIFDPFFSTKSSSKGTGLGLAICYGIIKKLNGTITVHSAKEEGTEMRIYLPCSMASEQELSQLKKGRITDREKNSSITILVVDDEKEILSYVTEILSGEGYKLLTAGTAEEGLDLFQKNSAEIDLLLTDFALPRMNGQEMYCEISSIRKDLKVLYMSGYADRILGSDDLPFIQKPFSQENLMELVEHLLYGES